MVRRHNFYITSIAYPYGIFNDRVTNMLRNPIMIMVLLLDLIFMEI